MHVQLFGGLEMSFWLLDGEVVCDAEGHPIDCETCPCEAAVVAPCSNCTITPSEIAVQFVYDDPTCPLFTTWWSCGQMPLGSATQAGSILWLAATYPSEFNTFDESNLGCTYGLFSGLPCDIQGIVISALYDGAGNVDIDVFVIWSSSNIAGQLFFTHVTPSGDCVANFTFNDTGQYAYFTPLYNECPTNSSCYTALVTNGEIPTVNFQAFP